MRQIIQLYRDCWLAGYSIEELRDHVTRADLPQPIKDCVLAEMSRIDGMIKVANQTLH